MASRFDRIYRIACWVGFLCFPAGVVMGVLDYGAHLEGGPGIGFEGGGHAGAAGNALMMIGFASGVLGFVARMLSAEPKPSIAKLGILVMVSFFGSALLSRPAFHTKWERDCADGVGRACGALAQLLPTTDPAHGTLERKACTLGDNKACGRLTKGTADERTVACATKSDFCGRSAWPESVCKDLDGACPAN